MTMLRGIKNNSSEGIKEEMGARGRAGGLAKRGKRSARKIKELAVNAAMKQRIFEAADKLLNSQMIAAAGTHRMVVLSFDDEGKKHIETVRDETRMQKLLDTGIYGEDYLILEGSKPDWKAAESLLTRAFGKPKETTDINVKHSFSLVELAKQRAQLPALEAPIEPTPVPSRIIEAP